jgi:hypothetical protein
MKTDVNVPSKSNEQKNFNMKIVFTGTVKRRKIRSVFLIFHLGLPTKKDLRCFDLVENYVANKLRFHSVSILEVQCMQKISWRFLWFFLEYSPSGF